MATDPIQGIQTDQIPTPLVLHLPAVIRRLAMLPPSTDVPYLTVSLDWRPDGNNPALRPARRQFETEAEQLLAEVGPHGAAADSARADVQRISAYLDDLPAEAHGVVIVAQDASDVWEPLPLGQPVPTRLTAGPTPALATLTWLAAANPTYAVLQADQQDAMLSVITQAVPEQRVAVEGSEYPHKQAQGGWSQRRYQARADEKVAAFARGVAEATRRTLDEAGIPMLIVAAEETMATALADAFHQTVTARIIGHVGLEMRAGQRALLQATLPLVERAAREREAAAVAALNNVVGGHGRGVSGAEETLTALQTGQVMRLIIADDFAGAGWADFTLPTYGAGEPPTVHPYGGDAANLTPVDLTEEMIRLALQTDAEIEVVRSTTPVSAAEQADVRDADAPPPRTAASQQLADLGGVGAILRFALEEDQPTADL